MASTDIKQSSNKITFNVSRLSLVFAAENKYFKKTDYICEMCKKKLSINDATIGQCGHAFHTTCINTVYADKVFVSCPVDNVMWSVKKIYK